MNLFICLLLIVLLHEANQANGKNDIPNKKVCETEACKISASSILKSMNKSIDPCEDFYSFSCDGWMKRKHLDANVFRSIRMEILLDIIKILEKPPENLLTKIERKATEIFIRCKSYDTFDNNTIKWFEELFEKIGGFPILDPEWNEDEYDWVEAFSQLSLLVHSEPLIVVHSKIDNKNFSRNILMISQPPRGEAVDIRNVVLYPFYFEKARGGELPVEVGGTVYNDVLSLYILQDKLKSITKYKEDFEDFENLETTMQIEDLQYLIPSIDWISFLEKATGHLLPINEYDDIVVNLDYLMSLIEMIDNGTISKRTIANFLSYNAMANIMEHFPKSLHYLIENFRPNIFKRSVTDINEEDTDRKLTDEETQKIICFASIISHLNFAIDHMFLKHRKPWNSKLDNIVENINISLKQILKRQDWMDKNTKKLLLDKQKEMAVLYDYPKWIIDSSNIEKFYETFPEVTSNPLENYLIMVQFARKQNLLFVTNRNNRLKWPLTVGISASSLNAFYIHGFNTIILPFVLKHPKLFNVERPSYLNYGSIGMIIGHEMGHAFDKQNIQRDKYGVLINWTNENSKKEYLERSQCFVEHYGNYTVNSRLGIELDGKKTVSQNIADHIGVKTSYRAFRRIERLRGQEPLLPGLEEYTTEQMFFISFGTSWCETEEATENSWKNKKSDHSPSKFRILGTLSNMEEFSKAFKCKKGSKMNPTNKCKIF